MLDLTLVSHVFLFMYVRLDMLGACVCCLYCYGRSHSITTIYGSCWLLLVVKYSLVSYLTCELCCGSIGTEYLAGRRGSGHRRYGSISLVFMTCACMCVCVRVCVCRRLSMYDGL